MNITKVYRKRGRMKFNNGMFIINVKIDNRIKDAANYDSLPKVIHLNLLLIKCHYEELSMKQDYFKEIIIHELTHWFDYNCWYSWSYKEDNPIEHLATFNQIFYKHIEEFTNMIYDHYKDQLKE